MPRWTKRGFTLPGYKYLGPFNSLERGIPTNKADAAAFKHDVRYGHYSTSSRWAPYLKFNKADEDFLQEIEGETDYGARIAKAFFKAKRFIAPRLQEHDLNQVIEASQAKALGKRLRGPKELPKPRFARTGEPDVSKFIEGNIPQTLSNLQANAQPNTNDMSGGGGSGNAPGLKETPIDIPDSRHPVSRGPADYTFATLPYVRQTGWRSTRIGFDHAFRMTSPYDPQITMAAATDLNAGAGSASFVTVEASDASDNTATSARWYDFYSTMYDYYHVLGARWHMTIENQKTEPLMVHVMYFNDEVPPLGATNEDIMCWNDVESHTVGPIAHAITSSGYRETNELNSGVNNVEGGGATGNVPNFETGNMVSARGKSNILQLSGSYKPGQKKRQIHLDSEVENWTTVNANPALPEKLLFRFKHFWNGLDTNDANTYDRDIAVTFTFRIEYLVEFKQLKTGLRWPVERQPLTALVVTNIEEDEE